MIIMQMEVTEKEAKSIYSQRYLAKSSRVRYLYLPIVIAFVALVVSLYSMQHIGDWLGVFLFAILISPSVYLFWRVSHNSDKYAKSQIEEQK